MATPVLTNAANEDVAAASVKKRTGSVVESASRLVRFAFAVDPRAFVATVVLSLGASLAEGAGLVLLLPLLAAAGMNFGGSSAASWLGGMSQGVLVRVGVPHGLWLPVMLGIFLATGAMRSMLRRWQSMMSYTTTTRVQLALSRRVYGAIVRAQWGFLVRQRAGSLTHVLTEELRSVADAITLTLSLINLGFFTLLYLVIAMKLSAAMTGLVLALGAMLMWAQRRSVGRTRASGQALSDSVSEVYASTAEHLLNLKSVKTYDAEEQDIGIFSSLTREAARHATESARHLAGTSFRFEVGSLVALGAVIFLALGVIKIQPATMLLLLAIFTRLMPQLASLQSQAHQYASILPAFEHVLRVEDECRAHAEPTLPSPAAGDAMRLEREFKIEDVWFAYPTSDVRREPEFVLRGVTLPIEAGLLTAVIGSSGAGKSTLADLTNGLLLPGRGRVMLDGRELDGSGLRRWRRHVGYVGQDTVLFHQSIRENLLWARPEATDAEVREALELASAEFVYKLPGGLESIAGDRGILLSSGQRQRIALARALLRRPSLLVLDEATNALDVENEQRILDAIREAMRALRGELTILMIAHRSTAIRRADRIFEIEAGRVVRSGTWEELNRPEAATLQS